MMRASPVQADVHAATGALTAWKRRSDVVLVAVLLFAFFVGIRAMGTGFEGLGHDLSSQFFSATQNPFVALSVGLLGTTLVQSSSVTTSMIVAMVAAPSDPLPIANAIPMVMGANIGTTVTNTIVAMGHIGRPDEFKRALAAATCHDFFNLLTALLLLPLEIATGLLRRVSSLISGALAGIGGTEIPNPIKTAASACVDPVQRFLGDSLDNAVTGSAILTALAMLLIFLCLTAMVRLLRRMSANQVKTYVTRALDAHPLLGIIVGAVVTVMVQSSSISTSVLVPLAGAGLVTLRQVFPITLGANIGTTITALIASLAAPKETAELAVQIAIVHLLFNVLGVAVVYPLKFLRRIPLEAARRLAVVAQRSRRMAVVYLLGLFYGIPGALILAWQLL